MNIQDTDNIDLLLDEVKARFMQLKKDATMVALSVAFSPIDSAGERIRTERKKQNLTLNDLCELSGVAYGTLCKIEQGHPSARLDSVVNVSRALGMKLWIG